MRYYGRWSPTPENEKYRFFLESILENLPIATTVKDKNDEGRYLIWNKKSGRDDGSPRWGYCGTLWRGVQPLLQDNFIRRQTRSWKDRKFPSPTSSTLSIQSREYILSFHNTSIVLQQREREVDCQFCTGHPPTAGSQRESRRSQPPEIGFFSPTWATRYVLR